ncbi:hypothetical protein BD626DRAFT_520645 [Schizophyllum amplum]|uniref:F-box domain-containing protein n=1 Tax=Schizophyllum amplum TaxID=97359 RepID=A0A550BUA6_9AGAR|nr:hypothetical protein BD626DRAFT_520645 [Auriculariopsis ampla]
MSHIWTNIRVHMEHSPRQWGDVVASYLERSQSRALSLVLDFTIDPNPFAESDVWPRLVWDPAAWSMLCAHATRWKSVYLDAIPRAAYVERPVSCPILSRLSVGLEDMADVPTQFFADAPALKTFAVSSEDTLSPFALPGAWKLTEFALRDKTAAVSGDLCGACAPALRSCSSTLVHLRVSVQVGGEWEGPPVLLEALQTMSLARGACRLMCRHLTVPNIQRLRLRGGWKSFRTEELDALQSLVQRSCGLVKLRILDLYAMAASGTGILRCLAILPSVTSLLLDIHTHPNLNEQYSIVHGLTRSDVGQYSANDVGLLPNLTTLSIRFAYKFSASHGLEGAVLNMLRSRASGMLVAGVSLSPLEAFSSDLGDWPVSSSRLLPQ